MSSSGLCEECDSTAGEIIGIVFICLTFFLVMEFINVKNLWHYEKMVLKRSIKFLWG